MQRSVSNPGTNDNAQERTIALAFDPRNLPTEYYDNPYPIYHALRRHEPVHRCPDGSYFLTRYADLRHVYRNARGFSSDKQKEFKPKFGESLLYEHHTTSLVFNDPPLHTHVRKAFGDALSAKTVVAMEDNVCQLVEGLLDRIAEKGTFDLIEDYAGAIPVEVIGNLLRVPHQERGPLRRWSLAILGALEPAISPEQFENGNRCLEEFLDYLRGFVAERRQHLSDDDDDILSRLIRWESEGYRLSEKELYHQCIFLLNAGHETTTNLIGNGIYALVMHPNQLARLQQAPRLIHSAVEELLRYESPNQFGNRMTTAEVEIGGVTIPAWTTLTLCIGAANRDPEVFPAPDQLDITRSPNEHLAFGTGIHTCAGLNVARLEGRIAIGRLFERFPNVALAGKPVRARRARFRGFVSVPMRIG